MFFWIGMSILGLAFMAVTYKTLVGYENCSWILKGIVFLLLLAAWFGPLAIRMMHVRGWLGTSAYAFLSKGAYFLMGFAFLLIMLILLRELVWYTVYFISKNQALNPDNPALLHRNNMWTLAVVFLISIYGVYAAHKMPAARTLEVEDARILKPTRLVVASDLHIDQATSLERVKQFVDRINSLNPDYVLLVGDVIDDVPDVLTDEMEELKKIAAQKVFVSLGNHEYYNAYVKWMIQFTKMGFEVLHNTGAVLPETGIYVGGVPDANSDSVNFEKAAYWSDENMYKILMSHSPVTADDLETGQFNLQVSGHTHGGQIFPFTLLAKLFNGYLAGEYEVNGNRLFVSRGAGYWGPPMRLLAPSDVVLVELKGQSENEQK